MPASMSTDHAEPAKPTPPWYFLFLDFQFGAAVGFLSITVPFWMERRGYPLAQIAAVSAGANLAHAVKIFWIPILDLGAFRRLWYLAMVGLNAALFALIALLPDPLANLGLFGALLTALQAAATTGHAANNALMATTTRLKDKGKVGGFAMASNVGSTSLLGAAALLVADAWSPKASALLMAGIGVAASLPALWIVEPVVPFAAGWDGVRSRLAGPGRYLAMVAHHLLDMLRDLWRTVTSRAGFTGLIICLAPVGCQAMSNLFTGMAGIYGASASIVSLANGVGGGVAGALGALVGGVLADRMSRRLAYAASGGLTALCAVAMAMAPLTPATYVWGTFTYLFAGGLAFATWAGMVLEMVGVSAATATKYALFNASANLAISYVTFLDGWFADYRGGPIVIGWRRVLSFSFRLPAASDGARGALLADAVLTAAGIAILLAMVFVVRRTRARPGEDAAPG
jgi:hypothetical protein